MKKILLVALLCAMATDALRAQNQITTTGNNVVNTSDPYAADIVIGSGGGNRHDASQMWWSNASAARISLTGDIFNLSQWFTTTPNIGLAAAVGAPSYFQGSLGIGIPTPNTRLQVNSDNNGSGYNNWVAGNFGGTAGNRVGLGLLDGHATIGAHNNALTAWANLSLNTEGGNVGIGTTNPLSLLQVDDGCTKASIGDASGSGLNWGTSYLGFNASRSGTSWNISTDSQYNGGGVIYSNILGEIYFAPIPSTGTTDQTLSDTDIKNKITFRVSADGTTYAKKIKVELANWPDYVFKPTYSLMPLTDVKSYIDKNHHLPDMPSAEQVEKEGLDLGEMNKVLTKKVEELTLYLIGLKAEKEEKEKEQQKQLTGQQQQIDELKAQMAKLLQNK